MSELTLLSALDGDEEENRLLNDIDSMNDEFPYAAEGPGFIPDGDDSPAEVYKAVGGLTVAVPPDAHASIDPANRAAADGGTKHAWVGVEHKGENADAVTPLGGQQSPAKEKGSLFKLRAHRRGGMEAGPGGLGLKRGSSKSPSANSTASKRVPTMQAGYAQDAGHIGNDLIQAENLFTIAGSPELLKANKQIHDRLDGRIRKLNLANAVLGTCCVVLTVLLMELTFEDGKFDPDLSEAWPAQLIKGCQTLITVVQQVLLYRLYQNFVMLDTTYIGLGSPPIHQSDRFIYYIAETALNVWHAPPMLHLLGIDPILLDKGSIMTLLRLYQWFRVYRDRHPLFRYRRWVVMSLIAQHPRKSLADLEIDTMLVFKHMYTRQPWQFFLASAFGAIFFFSYGMYIAERVEQPDVFTSFQNIVYFVLVTMTTVGYGDYNPVSTWGRAVAISCAIVGITLMSLLLTTMVYFLEFSSSERRASNLTVKRKYNELVAGIDAANPDLMWEEEEREIMETEQHLALFSTTVFESGRGSNTVTNSRGSGSPCGDASPPAPPSALAGAGGSRGGSRESWEPASKGEAGHRGSSSPAPPAIQSGRRGSTDTDTDADADVELAIAAEQESRGEVTLRAPGGICGLCMVPQVAKEYANRIRTLKRRRKYLNKERGQITISDQVLQVGVEVQEMHHELNMSEHMLKVEVREIANMEAKMEANRKQKEEKEDRGALSDSVASPTSNTSASTRSTPVRTNSRYVLSRRTSKKMNMHDRKKNLSSMRLESFSAKRKSVYDASVARKIVFGDEGGNVPINMDPELCALSDETIAAFDTRIKNLNLVILGLSMLCIFLAVVFLELGWNGDGSRNPDGTKNKPYESVAASQPIKAIISFLTACSIYVIYLYYSTLVQFDAVMYKSKGRKTNLSIWNSDRLTAFLIEVLVTALHAPPWADNIIIGEEPNGDPTRLIYDKGACIVFFRLFFLMRVYRDHSNIYRWRKWLLTNADFRSNSPRINFNTVLSMKTLFSYSPWTFTAAGAAISVFFFAYLIYAAERIEQFRKFSTAENCIYFICVTMTTVGYGDLSPTTVYGRFTAMVAATTGLCLSALLVTATMVSIGFSPNERKASQLVLARKTRMELRDSAARVMQVAWGLHKLRVNGELKPTFLKRFKSRRFNPFCVNKQKYMQSLLVTSIRDLRRLVSYWFQFHGRDLQHNTETQLSVLNESVMDLTQNIRDLQEQLEKVKSRAKLVRINSMSQRN